MCLESIFFKEFFSFPYPVLTITFSLPTKGPLDSQWLEVRVSAPGTGSRPLSLPLGRDSGKIRCSSVRYVGCYRSGPAHAKSSGGSERPLRADLTRGRDERPPACTELRRRGQGRAQRAPPGRQAAGSPPWTAGPAGPCRSCLALACRRNCHTPARTRACSSGQAWAAARAHEAPPLGGRGRRSELHQGGDLPGRRGAERGPEGLSGRGSGEREWMGVEKGADRRKKERKKKKVRREEMVVGDG